MGREPAEQLNDIALKVGRLEVIQETNTKAIGEMAASVNRLVERLEKSDDVAREALQSSAAAHQRLNMHDRIIYWAVTTIIGTVAVGIITFIMGGN